MPNSEAKRQLLDIASAYEQLARLAGSKKIVGY